MISCLFLVSAFYTYIAYQNSKLRLLSPTFWASGMFMAFSFIYLVTLFSMKSDISPFTFFAIVLFLSVTAIGEYMGNKITVKKDFSDIESEKLKIISECEGIIYISKGKVIVITIIFMIVAMDRYRNLVSIASSYSGGGFSGIMNMMTYARRAFVDSNRSVVLSNTVFNQLVYMCEITAYIMIFVFLFNWISYKDKRFYLLLPLIPDLFIRFVSTSRTGFIIFVVAIIISYFWILLKKERLRKLRISPKLIIGVTIFVVVFMIYGRIRNEAKSIPVINYLQMYTCSSIYGLEDLLQKNWDGTPYFGFYTLQKIYSLLGIEHDVVRTWGRMVVFSKNNYHANLYTSLANPIMDFGIIGCMMLRFFAAFIATKIISNFAPKSYGKRSFYIYLFFAISMIYCYFYSATGDVFADYFFNPGLMIRYLVYGWILVKLYLKPTVVEKGES